MTITTNPITTNQAFELVPISPAAADALRAAGGIRYVAGTKPGYPCRQCLRDADVGEELILVSYDPFTRDSPYRCASPIFVHALPCTFSTTDADDLPVQLTTRQLSVRAFDVDEMMIDAAVIEGRELGDTITRLLDNHAIDHLHVHNAIRGCWAVSVRRP